MKRVYTAPPLTQWLISDTKCPGRPKPGRRRDRGCDQAALAALPRALISRRSCTTIHHLEAAPGSQPHQVFLVHVVPHLGTARRRVRGVCGYTSGIHAMRVRAPFEHLTDAPAGQRPFALLRQSQAEERRAGERSGLGVVSAIGAMLLQVHGVDAHGGGGSRRRRAVAGSLLAKIVRPTYLTATTDDYAQRPRMHDGKKWGALTIRAGS